MVTVSVSKASFQQMVGMTLNGTQWDIARSIITNTLYDHVGTCSALRVTFASSTSDAPVCCVCGRCPPVHAPTGWHLGFRSGPCFETSS